MKSFPERSFLLYGEEELPQQLPGRFDVIFMPAFELPNLSSDSIDLCFSSHTLSALMPEAKAEYIQQVERATKDLFLYIGHGSSATLQLDMKKTKFVLEEESPSEWNHHMVSSPNEFECLYRAMP